MKLLILIDQETQRVVRVFTENQSQFERSQTDENFFPNCERRIVDLNDQKIIHSPAKKLALEVVDELKQWEIFEEAINSYKEEDLDELIDGISSLLSARMGELIKSITTSPKRTPFSRWGEHQQDNGNESIFKKNRNTITETV